jgi:hypothetical protein
LKVTSKLVALVVASVILGILPPPARAGVPGRAAREAAGAALRLLGREAELEGTEALARKIERLAVRHNDDVVAAVLKGGPEAVRLIEAAGVHGEPAARVLARYGPEAARIVARPALLELVERHGEDAVRALVRHPGLAESVVGALGKPGARALAMVGPRNARRLAMLVADGSLQRMGRVEEVLRVIERYGDRALDFVWRHKGALAVGSALAAFLRDPEPFLGRTRDLSVATSEAIGVSLAGAAGRELGGLARPGLILSVAVLVGLMTRLVWGIRRRLARQ